MEESVVPGFVNRLTLDQGDHRRDEDGIDHEVHRGREAEQQKVVFAQDGLKRTVEHRVAGHDRKADGTGAESDLERPSGLPAQFRPPAALDDGAYGGNQQGLGKAELGDRDQNEEEING